MLFNSFAFLIFFLLVTVGYFLLPHRFRWMLLLAASCYFYMDFVPKFMAILGFTIVVDYIAGILIEQSEGGKRRLYLALSIVANVGVLAVFKYVNFINENLRQLASLLHWNYPIETLALVLPIGLSFHTFQAMSYTIEVYRGKQKAERHFGIYSLYVMFYPQLVAGPIERPQNILHQLWEKHEFSYANAADGLRLMAWGMFKKVIVADRLAMIANPVFSAPSEHHGPAVVAAVVAFAFQIFYDFSGYSDIAIGSARVMGFELMTNFSRPYFAQSIGDFWRRWHISLSTWFRDYLYIPLGGSRVSTLLQWRNILIVFAVSGIWHGANWTFVIWGLLHGIFWVAERATEKARATVVKKTGLVKWPRLHIALRVAVTFALVNVGWVFFRATSVENAMLVLKGMFSGWGILAKPASLLTEIGVSRKDLFLGILGLGIVETAHLLQALKPRYSRVQSWPFWLRWPAYYAIVAALFFFYTENGDQFVYFQF